MPYFHQYSKFTSKHIVSVKVDFAIDLACVISTSATMGKLKSGFFRAFQKNYCLFCFKIQSALNRVLSDSEIRSLVPNSE